MERVELLEAPFKRVIGTTISVFQKMMSILHTAYDQLHESGVAESDLTVSDKLLIALQYYQEYRTMEYIAVDYTCSKSSVYRSI